MGDDALLNEIRRMRIVLATQAGIRVMYIWPDERHAVATLIRLGRGKMMGVDHNKNMEWVGASAELWSD